MTDQPRPRVRFAPSPTGYLHVGGLRTALYNYLFARKAGGTFILRIEDTDRTRYVEGAVENLIQTLAWSGLSYDEGPAKGGERGPYVQSERLGIYREHVDRLLSEGNAYRCFCTSERLEEMRKQQEKMRIAPKYDRLCLRLPKEEVDGRIAAGEPAVVRMRIPESVTIVIDDLIRGRVEFQSDRVDDQVLMKSDGYPTYHLANVVDDRLMGITHVIRGEEWLSSTPKHALLYGYFGWDAPKFAHLPLLLNPDRSKLSKRQGDVAVEDYRAAGYLPEALVNFVALLGWNPGDEREIFTLEELVKEFSLERVGKSGAIFNVEKLKWINQQHLRRLDAGVIIARVKPVLKNAGLDWRDDAYLGRVVAAMRDRLNSFDDFSSFALYFFADPKIYDEAARKKNWSDQSPGHIEALIAALPAGGDFTEAPLEEALKSVAETAGVGAGKVIHAVRLALSGLPIGPGLYELMAILGRETVLRRLRTAVETMRGAGERALPFFRQSDIFCRPSMLKTDIIRIHNAVFYAYHGVASDEQNLGGHFEIDVELRANLSAALENDDLKRTVDYEAVYGMIHTVVTSRKYFLLEALANTIARGILQAWPVVEAVTVRVRKPHPPVKGVVEYVEVEITDQR